MILLGYNDNNSEIQLLFWRKLTGLKITVNKNCPTKRKRHQIFCPMGKIRGKTKCPRRLCFCPTINWRCRSELLILSKKIFLTNSSTQSREFYRNTYIEGVYRNITLSHSFLRHHLQTKKKHCKIIFFHMCAVSDFIKRSWDESIYSWSFGIMMQISRICKKDSFFRWAGSK